MDHKAPDFSSFQEWYETNQSLVDDLQTWLFYIYALKDRGIHENDESRIEVADLTVYLLLFYLSSLNENKYSFETTLSELVDILQTDREVVVNALNSLQEHKALTYNLIKDNLSISIEPIHIHSHEHHHHH